MVRNLRTGTSYFEKEGLRVFWIVPRKFTDEILPLKLNPAPVSLERVLVGRTEVLTAAFEKQLVKDFTENTSYTPYWLNSGSYGKTDRFFRAWQTRVEQIYKRDGHKFDFLEQITYATIRPGEIAIIHDDKKPGNFTSLAIGDMSKRLEYQEVNGQINGTATYFYSEPDVKSAKLELPKTPLRKAIFNMKDGILDGECKIYDISDTKQDILLHTRNFKNGKEI
jgi:hypothetical protein